MSIIYQIFAGGVYMTNFLNGFFGGGGCNNNCGTGCNNGLFGGDFIWLIILILLFCGGGCGNNGFLGGATDDGCGCGCNNGGLFGGAGSNNGFFGDGGIIWIIILILLFCNNGCGNVGGTGTDCCNDNCSNPCIFNEEPQQA